MIHEIYIANVTQRVFFSFRYLATGSSFRALAFEFRMGRSTVADIVKETCATMWVRLQPKYMPFPNKEICKSSALDFQNK